MLNSLATFERSVAGAALAATVGHLLTGQSVPDELREPSEKILTEARDKLSLSSDDDRPAAVNRLRELLTKEVDRLLLGSRDRKAILNRLGNDGTLPLGVYEVRGSESLGAHKETLGFAKKCILGSDAHQHLVESEGRNWSLFSKYIASEGSKKAHFAVVEAQRDQKVLTVTSLWRVDRDLIGERPSGSPIDLLKAFTDHYGVPFSLQGVPQKDRLVLDKLVFGDFTIEVPQLDVGVKIAVQMLTSQNNAGGSTVHYAYAINETQYLSEVKRLR